MAWIFEAIDPEGRRIRLSEDRWQQHILSRRSFLRNLVEGIQEAIARPQIIQTGNRPFTLVYTGQPIPSGFHKDEVIRVVVLCNRAYSQGEILTVYITGQSYQGDIVWIP